MSVKKYLDYEGLQRYDANWLLEFEAMALNDDDLENVWNEAFPETWSFTVNTEATTSGATKTSIPFNLYGQSGIQLTVDWGDGNASTLTPSNYAVDDSTASVHTYASAGTYTVTVASNKWKNTCLLTLYHIFSEIKDENLNNATQARYWFEKTLIRLNSSLPKCYGTNYYSSPTSTNSLSSRTINDFSNLFLFCRKLQSISFDLFQKNPDAVSFQGCFCECSSIQEIPEGLFSNNAAVTSYQDTFKICTSLRVIPNNLFASSKRVTTFISTFEKCTSLTTFPGNIFNLEVDGNLARTFKNCTALTSIPSGLFDNCTLTKNISGCFGGCTSLQSIPVGLFDNNTAVTTFYDCFYDCSSLTSIPSGLFTYNTAVTDFSSCFNNCSSLTSIPSGLFTYNTAVTDFSSCFNNCSSLTSIPTLLFENNTLVTNFSSCFEHCSSITSIPALFEYNTKVTTFSYCFSGCSAVTSVSSRLFDNNTAVTTLNRCFYNCSNLGNFNLNISSTLVTNADSFVTKKDGTTRVIFLPDGSTTQTTFNSIASDLGLTIQGYY